MGRFKRSAELFKQAWIVLKSDPELVIFPILSFLATAAVMASFAIPILMSEELRHAFTQLVQSRSSHSHNGVTTISPSADAPTNQIVAYALMFSFYLVTSFVTIFFNAALLGAADRKFRGETGGLGAGIQVAMSRLPQIAAWTLVSAVVGTILRAIEQRVGIIGKIVVGFIGLAWAVGTYFAVPALVIEGVGPIDAIKRSASAIKRTWGEGLILAVGFGLVGFAITMFTISIIGIGVVAGILSESVVLGVAIGLIGLLSLFAWSLIASTLRSIVQMALYRYAIDGSVPTGFKSESLQLAFAPKKG
ncbi:MAG: DUF6159 family protein [Planctomycetes bacterium]|nr:DUF6159 family protein [Planctomycetota bacterium]